MPRRSKPWAVICATPDGPTRTEHTGEKLAYEQVRAEADRVQAGISRVTRIRVDQWEKDTDRWIYFDDIDPKEW